MTADALNRDQLKLRVGTDSATDGKDMWEVTWVHRLIVVVVVNGPVDAHSSSE